LFERWGIVLAYHPEQREVSSGLYERFLAATDERCIRFLADVGHLCSGWRRSSEGLQDLSKSLARRTSQGLRAGAWRAAFPIKAGNVSFGSGLWIYARWLRGCV